MENTDANQLNLSPIENTTWWEPPPWLCASEPILCDWSALEQTPKRLPSTQSSQLWLVAGLSHPHAKQWDQLEQEKLPLQPAQSRKQGLQGISHIAIEKLLVRLTKRSRVDFWRKESGCDRNSLTHSQRVYLSLLGYFYSHQQNWGLRKSPWNWMPQHLK